MKLKNLINLNLLIIFLFISCGCGDSANDELSVVDFSKKSNLNGSNTIDKYSPSITFAVSAMISPKKTYHHYKTLLDYISKKIERPIVLKQRKTYGEINDLLKEKKLDFALLCSGSYIKAIEYINLEILAVPMVNKETYYYSYIIVNRNSYFKNFDQLKGHSFAFTDKLSNTGRFYPLFLINKKGLLSSEYFSKIIFTYSHDNSIYAVSKGIVDGASVDSLIFDFFKKNEPESVKNIRIIKKSVPFGIPPIVVNSHVDRKIKRKFRKILVEMYRTKTGKKILLGLGVDKFIAVKKDIYSSLKKMVGSIKEK